MTAPIQIFDNSYKNVRNISATAMRAEWYISKGGNGTTTTVSASQLPMYMTGINIAYQRGVTPMYVLNAGGSSDTQLNLIGRPAGSLTVSSVVSAYQSDLAAFLKAVGVTCSDESNTVCIKLSPIAGTCSRNAMYSYLMRGVLLNGLNVSIQGGAVAMITDSLSFTFLDLTLEPPTSK